MVQQTSANPITTSPAVDQAPGRSAQAALAEATTLHGEKKFAEARGVVAPGHGASALGKPVWLLLDLAYGAPRSMKMGTTCSSSRYDGIRGSIMANALPRG
jgi:hypothetical protein